MAFKIDPTVVQNGNHHLIADRIELLHDATPAGYWSMIADLDHAVATDLAKTAPVEGYLLGAVRALEGAAYRHAVGKVAEEFATVMAGALTPVVDLDLDPAELFERLTVIAGDTGAPWIGQQHENFALLKANLGTSISSIVPFNVLFELTAANAANGANGQPPAGTPHPTDEELAKTRRESATDANGKPLYKSREQKALIDRNPFTENPPLPVTSKDLVSSPPDANGLYWMRWTAVEHPPLPKGEFEMLFVHRPVEDTPGDGDHPSIDELPGGTILAGHKNHKYTNGHVGRRWKREKLNYWVEMPGRADFVRLGQQANFYTAFVKSGPQGFIDWVEIRKKIEKEIKDNDLEDKIEEEVKDFLGDLLDGVEIAGVSVGKIASPVAKAVAALAMEVIDWLADLLLGDPRFPMIVVLHMTEYRGTVDPISHVSWTLKHPDTDKTSPSPFDVVEPEWWTKPMNQRIKKSPRSFIAWSGESKVPDKGASPARMVNTRENMVVWASPGSGGHIFIPIKTVDEDGHYVIALRTEVRKVAVEFQG